MRTPSLIACGIICAMTLSSCSSIFPWWDADEFVAARGTRLMVGERPYYFAGTNLWYGLYLGSNVEAGGRERLRRELDSLAAHGISNLRVLGGSEFSTIKGSVSPAIQQAPGVLDESLLEGLDVLLAEMADREMRAVVYFTNYWEWSGGMTRYVAWANGEPGVDPHDTAQGWEAYMNYAASFYANPAANALYREYLERIITRRNSVNGRLYSEDPTIMAWQLANEPRPGTIGPEGKSNVPAFVAWVNETAGFIHSLDTNHLVSTGSEGTIGCLQEESVFLDAHATSNIDYLTFHLWPYNWKWFDPKDAEQSYDSTVEKSLAYLRLQLALARRLQKPTVMEEFGLVRDGERVEPGTAVTKRDLFYALMLSTVLDSARAGAPIAGSNFWAWGGEGRAQRDDRLWRPGDPFLGDPPQEPQGMNSVFAADASTIAILREHARRMMRLAAGDSTIAIASP